MSATSRSRPAESESSGSPFQFLSDLARELSAGRVDLPSFPDAVARVQHVLSDDSITSERIARVVSSDAGLAARILTMANSTLLHRGGSRVTDLKIAITRIGHDSIRAAALAYATAQVRHAAELAHIRRDLEGLWREGVRVAALAHAMAKESRLMRPDEALLAGLLHNIGKVYIIARTPKDASNVHVDDAVLRDWHPGIGQALIENWKLPEEIAVAVGGQLEIERCHGGPADLQDLLIVTVNLAAQMANNAADDAALVKMPAAAAMGLTDSAFVRIMLESQTEMETLRAALG
ncbi:MAG: HDOD domain-containing protein [Steroidobacteraceae bacterium]|nr:HDOD domain-containing protein [Steroidobacteraceae bacterium]